MNVKLLRKVQKHIQQVPSRLFMTEGVVVGKPKTRSEENFWSPDGKESNHPRLPDCGTVGCIAGWTCILGDKKFLKRARQVNSHVIWQSVFNKARKLLGISPEQAVKLFRVHHFAPDLEQRFNAAKTSRGRVSAVREHIERFIATKGAE